MFDISVIITTKDEEANLKDCLESIKSQDYLQDKIELIVVDNNSTDNTKELARRYTNKVYNFGPERSAQRNYGARQANGRYLLFLDADMRLSPDVLSECISKCRDDDYIALYIPEKIIGDGFWMRVRDFERGFYNATVIDCVRFTRADKFLEIGGFDQNLTGPEDWDFDRRIKQAGRVDIIHSPIYHNEEKFNLKKYLSKKTYYMQWFSCYIQKWGKDSPTIKKQLGFCYRYFGVFLSNSKWKKLFSHPALALGLYALRVLVGVNFIVETRKHRLNNKKGILMLSPFFLPNIGGVEAYLDDFCAYLAKENKGVYVVAYQPITINRRGEAFEKRGSVEIYRYPWFGRDLFSKLEKHFLLNFLYISCGLFLYSLYFLLTKRRKISCIHAHGLNAAAIAVTLGKIFRLKVIVSLHTVYRLAQKPRMAMFVRAILNKTEKIFALGSQGKIDLVAAGVKPGKIEVYNYWVDAQSFTIKDKALTRQKLGLPLDKFIGLFVGRFVEQKGLKIVTEALKEIKEDTFLFLFIGDGPQRIYLDNLRRASNNVIYLGALANKETVDYYNASDILLWGSVDASYLGRVCIESLYCGLPVIAPNHCRILGVDYAVRDDVLPSSVGFLIPEQPAELLGILKSLYLQQARLSQMRNTCRSFALEHYGHKNAEKIISCY